MQINSSDVRLIAFYLPQYHPIPENNQWWGKGFTEWTNVAQARPRFRGHYQPRIPADLGFYDLRVPEAREAQAQLARLNGIHGFCYYHYWFNGKRLLERPFNEVLASGKPAFPFCLCWANENWTRAWDGGDRHILVGQNYSHEDDRAHIRSLLPALADRRYIRVFEKPLLLIYRTEIMPDPARTADIWREEARKAGLGEIYLARVESFDSTINPQTIGFDAAVEFAPDWRNLGRYQFRDTWTKLAVKLRLADSWCLDNIVTEYDALVARMLEKPSPDFRRIRCVTPGFDNSARRSQAAGVFLGSTPSKYGAWLRTTIAKTKQEPGVDDQGIVFINAWNEWGEGNYLEPDLKWGHAYLEATKAALAGDPVRKRSVIEAPVSVASNA
jgi:lipopolysaccharide biosynthesis protein